MPRPRKRGAHCRVYRKPQKQGPTPQPLNQKTGKSGKVIAPKKQPAKKTKKRVVHIGPLASGSATKPGKLIGKKQPPKHGKTGKTKSAGTTRKHPCGMKGPQPLAHP